jgi:hypothetical protein
MGRWCRICLECLGQRVFPFLPAPVDLSRRSGGPAMTRLVVYSTPGCHLCEQAEALLRQVAGAPAWHCVDVAGDDGLLERYGVRIPVVRRAGDGAELDWPFDLEALRRFVAAA